MKSPNFLSKVSHKAIAAGLQILAVLVLSLAVLPGGARADTFTTYTVNGTFQSGGSLTGTFTIDYNGQNPIVYSANFVADGATLTCTAANPCPLFGTTDLNNNVIHAIDVPMGSVPFLSIGWAPVDYSAPPNTLDISLYTYCLGCTGPNSFERILSATAIDPPNDGGNLTQTPEPSAALLFGMGLLGIGALVARRKPVNSLV